MATRSSASEQQHVTGTVPPIAVGVDPTGRSTSAVLWAVEAAEHNGHGLRLVSAVVEQTQEARAATHTDPAGLARRLTMNDVQYRTVQGKPRDVLTEASADCSMLVVGRRDMSVVAHLTDASTSVAVAARSTIPVVVVPEAWVQANMSSAPVVVGIEPRDDTRDSGAPSDPDHEILAFAFERAARMRVPLVVVTAWEIPALHAWSPQDIAASRTQLQAALDTRLVPWMERYPDVEIAPRCVAEPARKAIQEASRVAQLTVIGRHSGHHLPGARLGGTARSVLHHATRPVAIVPAGPPAEYVRKFAAPTWAPTF